MEPKICEGFLKRLTKTACVICLRLRDIELLRGGLVMTSEAVRSEPKLFKISYCPEVGFMQSHEQPQ